MGTFTYDSTVRIEVEDLHLAHLESVILAKLRRGERFPFSWDRSEADGGGRSVVWLNHFVPLAFNYDKPGMPKLHREWVEKMTAAANSTRGLRILPHPGDDTDEELSPEEQIDLAGSRSTAH